MPQALSPSAWWKVLCFGKRIWMQRRLWHLRIISTGFHGFSMCFFWPAMLLNTFGGRFVQTLKNLFISQFKLDQIGQLPEGPHSRWQLVARPLQNHVRQKSSQVFFYFRSKKSWWKPALKPACKIRISKPSSHTSPTCALVHGKSSKTQPCCKTSGESSRKRIAWMTSESTRNAERTCLEVLSKQNKVDLPQNKRSFPWTGRLDSKTSYSLFQKMVSSIFINLPSFVLSKAWLRLRIFKHAP